jgi:hypothetical protein
VLESELHQIEIGIDTSERCAGGGGGAYDARSEIVIDRGRQTHAQRRGHACRGNIKWLGSYAVRGFGRRLCRALLGEEHESKEADHGRWQMGDRDPSRTRPRQVRFN